MPSQVWGAGGQGCIAASSHVSKLGCANEALRFHQNLHEIDLGYTFALIKGLDHLQLYDCQNDCGL